MIARDPAEGGDPLRGRVALNLFARLLRFVGFGLVVVGGLVFEVLPTSARNELWESTAAIMAAVAGPLFLAIGPFLYSHSLRRLVVEHEE